ncbi:MAG: phosphatase PAP2 family protein [Paludibacteraceae bacterium]|nr:phosphatase PAP2 family protein [Paludibacteraceae bacterium]MBP3575323.1 phosphatase PAP2 family protein [Paludibacteraceae bacterium]
MLEQLLHIDTEVLLAINGWHAPWADTLMWIISAKATWIPLYVLLIGLLIWRYRQPIPTAVKWLQRVPVCVVMIVVIALAVGAADFIASGILKDWVARPRPTRVPELEGVLHLVNGYKSGRYGFVSSHAANTMACALLFSLIWRNKIATCGLMLWVAANCYSRMYLGVHYPLDILGGLTVGALVAVGAFALLRSLGVVCRANKNK